MNQNTTLNIYTELSINVNCNLAC